MLDRRIGLWVYAVKFHIHNRTQFRREEIVSQYLRNVRGYELTELLGQGAFGAVYRARQVQVNREVAIKVILPEYASHPDFVRRFEAEARIIAQLEHLHIVPLYDYWRDDNGAFLVMRLMDRSLKDLLETRTLTLQEVGRTMEQVGAALAHAHRRGVVHRDLKPANILLDEDGNAYLSDFGIAKGEQIDGGLTGTGAIIGSPGYLSPEQVRSETVTPQADIYALGVMLYELVTGEHPFPDSPPGVLMLKHLSDPLPRITDRHTGLPAGLDAVIQRATAKEMSARTPDAGVFLADIKTVLSVGTAETALPSFGTWVRHQRTVLSLSQDELAQIVGCAPLTIEKIEAGERRPSRQLARLLAENLVSAGDETPGIPDISTAHPSESAFPAAQPGLFDPAAGAGQEKESWTQGPVFVARERELAALETHMERVQDHRGSVVFVIGEAGYGKTTLLNEFTRRILDAYPETIIARGMCNAFSGMGAPYLPFRDVLAMLRGDFDKHLSAGLLARRQAANLAEFAPRVKEVLEQEGPDLVTVITPGRPTTLASGERDQLFIFEQFTQVLHTLSRDRPLVLLLDDLQWADSATLSLLFHIGMRLMGSRLLVIGSYRPSEVSLGRKQGFGGTQHPLNEMVGEFRRRFGNAEINLGETSAEEGQAFIRAYLDTEPNRLDKNFREALFHRTQGHPLFTVELLRSMQERGDISKDQEGCWIATPELDWEALPARVEAVIEQRLGRLDDDLREILSVGSIEGETFTAQVVAQVLVRDERALLRQLSGELENRHRLVIEQGEVETPEGILARYKFGHVIFQEYLFNRLSRAERRMLHKAVAEAIEGLYGIERPEVAPQLARHYRLAGDRDAALKYGLMAASLAESMQAYDEAVRHLLAALDLLPIGEKAAERFAILERLGDDHALLGEIPRALSLFERALDLLHLQAAGDKMDAVRIHRKIGEMVLYMTWYQDKQRFKSTGHANLLTALELVEDDSPHPEIVRLMTTLANEAWVMHVPPDWNLAEEFALQAVAMAEDIPAETELSAALDALGNVYGGQGKFRERLDVSLQRLALSRSPAFRDLRQKANILQQTGFAYLQVGEYREALPYLFEAEAISAEIQALDQLSRALRHQATCRFRLDEWEKVLEVEEKRLALVEKYPNYHERVGPT